MGSPTENFSRTNAQAVNGNDVEVSGECSGERQSGGVDTHQKRRYEAHVGEERCQQHHIHIHNGGFELD